MQRGTFGDNRLKSIVNSKPRFDYWVVLLIPRQPNLKTTDTHGRYFPNVSGGIAGQTAVGLKSGLALHGLTGVFREIETPWLLP